jgi:hypothetical protein
MTVSAEMPRELNSYSDSLNSENAIKTPYHMLESVIAATRPTIVQYFSVLCGSLKLPIIHTVYGTLQLFSFYF